MLRSMLGDGVSAWADLSGCLKIESGFLSSPRKAGTHTPRPLWVNGWSTALLVTEAHTSELQPPHQRLYRLLLVRNPEVRPVGDAPQHDRGWSECAGRFKWLFEN